MASSNPLDEALTERPKKCGINQECPMGEEYEDAQGLDRTADCRGAIADVQADVCRVMHLAGLLRVADETLSMEAAMKEASDAYFSLICDAGFVERSIRARRDSAVPRLLGLTPVGSSA